MIDPSLLDRSGVSISAVIGPPFEWKFILKGVVELEDSSQEGGTRGGVCFVADFLMARYLVTNTQYQSFIEAPLGFENPQWWEFSPQARQWRLDHPHPRPTAFPGDHLPRTRVSWFDSMAFCAWLSAKCGRQDLQPAAEGIRLPTEEEWQRAAVADTGWSYPWGNEIDPLRCNYGNLNGRPTAVDQYPEGQSPHGVMDMAGNVSEWCLTAWGKEISDLSGYTYRAMRGGAWNITNPAFVSAVSRYGHPPRGQLNDCGFRIVYTAAAIPGG